MTDPEMIEEAFAVLRELHALLDFEEDWQCACFDDASEINAVSKRAYALVSRWFEFSDALQQERDKLREVLKAIAKKAAQRVADMAGGE